MTKNIGLLGLVVLITLLVFSFMACGKKDADATEPVAEAPVAESPRSDLNNMELFIKDYEAFVDEYIAIVKRMQAGDMSVFVQLQDFQNAFANWENRMATLTEEDLTPENVLRLEAISKKVEEELSN